jgi:hypothetical protein
MAASSSSCSKLFQQTGNSCSTSKLFPGKQEVTGGESMVSPAR